MNRPKEARRARAQEREQYRKEHPLSPKEKLEQLDIKFGKNCGAKKERAKLATLMQAKDIKVEAIASSLISEEALAEIEEMNAPKKKKKAKERRNEQ